MLRLDPSLADIFNARGELWRKKGDRPRALDDFGAALKLNPNHPPAKANYKSLALELERLGALMAVNNKPSFNCATAKRAVEKAICANPELANLDREINAVNSSVVQRRRRRTDPRAGRALQREQDDFIAPRNAGFGRPDYDLQKAMRERLDHLLAVGAVLTVLWSGVSITFLLGEVTRVEPHRQLRRQRCKRLAAMPRRPHFREPIMRTICSAVCREGCACRSCS